MRRWLIVAAAAGGLGCGAARAQPTPPTPAAAQPVLPPSTGGSILGGAGGTEPLTVRKTRAARRHRAARHHRLALAAPLDRPALAGVELVTPIPHPIQPPHHTVPVPAYPLENFITFYTAPPPPVICRRAPRDPDAPDPHLVRERTVVCAADNP